MKRQTVSDAVGLRRSKRAGRGVINNFHHEYADPRRGTPSDQYRWTGQVFEAGVAEHDDEQPSEQGKEESLPPEVVCAVCFNEYSDELRVKCSKCSIEVHPGCEPRAKARSSRGGTGPCSSSRRAGSSLSPPWTCLACERGRSQVWCAFCPVEGGVHAELTQTHGFAHSLCATVINETWVNAAAGGVNGIPGKWRWQHRCDLCDTRNGAVVVCSAPGCKKCFHVMCAREAGNVFGYEESGSTGQIRELVYCVKHSGALRDKAEDEEEENDDEDEAADMAADATNDANREVRALQNKEKCSAIVSGAKRSTGLADACVAAAAAAAAAPSLLGAAVTRELHFGRFDANGVRRKSFSLSSSSVSYSPVLVGRRQKFASGIPSRRSSPGPSSSPAPPSVSSSSSTMSRTELVTSKAGEDHDRRPSLLQLDMNVSANGTCAVGHGSGNGRREEQRQRPQQGHVRPSTNDPSQFQGGLFRVHSLDLQQPLFHGQVDGDIFCQDGEGGALEDSPGDPIFMCLVKGDESDPASAMEVTLCADIPEIGKRFWIVRRLGSGKFDVAAICRDSQPGEDGIFSIVNIDKHVDSSTSNVRRLQGALGDASFIAAIRTPVGTYVSARPTGITANAAKVSRTERFAFFAVAD